MNDVVFRSYAAVLCLERDAEASRRGATHFESGVLAVESDESGLIVGLMGVDSLTDERGGEVRSGGIERSGNAARRSISRLQGQATEGRWGARSGTEWRSRSRADRLLRAQVWLWSG